MKFVIFLILTAVAVAQKLPAAQSDSAKDTRPVKAYTLTEDQQARLKKAGEAHEKCMAQKDPNVRNSCFHPTHHAAWLACEQVKKELKADPAATCDLDGTVKGQQ